MLVTFKTDAYANITMFGDVAITLIKLMGHSGTVPSALLAADVPQALARLQATMAADPDTGPSPAPQDGGDDDEEDDDSHVSLAHRAVPLIELLEAAIAQGSNVMWE